MVAALALLCSACAQQPEPVLQPAPTSTVSLTVDPARIDRAREALPPGYEVTSYDGPPAPIAVWGLVGGVDAQPPQCLELAAAPVIPASARGWSASGPGGIVYAVVAASARPVTAVPAGCRQWTAVAGHTTAVVTEISAPRLEAADTAGMSTDATTVVEGGTQTRSQAETFTAHLGEYVCFVSVVTDPGSTQPSLDAGFAADLLVQTVSALRG